MLLSGFLTFLPCALGKQVVLNGKIKYIIIYYKKKINKRYPAYAIGLLLALILGFLNDYRSVSKHLLCIEGAGHFGYMPVIIKFYLKVPFMIILLEGLKEKIFIILILLLTIIFSVLFPFTTYIENLYIYTGIYQYF